ncbi:hypothetical protein FHR95_001948 [Halomonas fontilapidosi]|uniref:Uncharacterized protein n=1 Tax=Halomonas fontilapidosi TaxID=616675 RepID=A0A7W5DK34_9GAMM|nr:hypothetical protein [Halomonas fontilapidosi]MBB3184387.1 hypothetical protein [Halomonas fontilapidosi]
MPIPIQHDAPATPTFTTFIRLPDREPGEQQHGYPFSPQRLSEAPSEMPARTSPEEPDVLAAEGDDDLMSQDINAVDFDPLL